VSAADQDGDPHVFQLLSQGAGVPFSLTFAGQLIVSAPLDFESVATYTLLASVNETSVIRNCPLSGVTALTVNVTNVPEEPVFAALSPLLVMSEELRFPAQAATATGNTSTALVVDLWPANTSSVTVVVRTTTVLEQLPLDGVPRRRVASTPYLTIVSAANSSLPCVGGVSCALVVAIGSPRWDYDAGLREVTVELLATGPTSLTAVATVSVAVADVNEGWPCADASSGCYRNQWI
jgi:hypothetical protein